MISNEVLRLQQGEETAVTILPGLFFLFLSSASWQQGRALRREVSEEKSLDGRFMPAPRGARPFARPFQGLPQKNLGKQDDERWVKTEPWNVFTLFSNQSVWNKLRTHQVCLLDLDKPEAWWSWGYISGGRVTLFPGMSLSVSSASAKCDSWPPAHPNSPWMDLGRQDNKHPMTTLGNNFMPELSSWFIAWSLKYKYILWY